MAERLTVGVAARLSRYLQVLTQAKKMGKDRISSQEIAEYTNINATQIRRDLSGVRQVRQARRRLRHRLAALRDPEDPADAGPAQHRSRRRGPPRRGDRSVADLRGARHHDRCRLRHATRPRSAGRSAASRISALDDLDEIVRERSIVVGVLAVPAESAQDAADALVAAGVKIIFNYSQALIDTPSDVQVHTSNPAVELLYALYFHLT